MKIALALMATALAFPAAAQQRQAPLFFSADRIYAVARTLAGDSAAWPVLIALSVRDAERNGFVLPPSGAVRLKELGKTHAEVKLGRQYFANLVKAGARVFAAERMNEASSLSSQYDRSIRDGNAAGALTAAAEFLAAVDAIAGEIEEKRTEEVDALIAQRQGEVAKRKGVLGPWSEANKGDLLQQSDGVKTGDDGFAQLAFTDGCDVMIDPRSTVLIRESKMDRLDRSIRRDIALVRGGLLTTLTAGARERNDLRLQAGSSQSEIRSGKFWASAVEERRVRLSNYDGTMKVTANRTAVNLAANEGTVVEQGKPPMKPVQLLAPPQLRWDRIDSTIYGPELLLTWNAVGNSSEYRIEISPSREFNRNINGYSSRTPALALKNIPLGVFFVRLYALDKLGLRGMESPVYKLVRIEDKLPPVIYLNGWETDRKYTILPAVTVAGTTEPDAQLTADGVRRNVAADGSFSFTVSVGRGEKQITLRSVDRSGNARSRRVSIVPMDTVKAMHVDWNGTAENGILVPAADEISGRGTSYPSVKITATLGGQSAAVQTDAQGNWAIALRRVRGETLTLRFESLSDHTVIGTRILQVE